MLKELERRCVTDVSWLKSFKSMIFGSSDSADKSLTSQLEEQIILADIQLCSAILTFLTQDLSGFMKGSWLLKKAWKIYQHAYNQIYNLYCEVVGLENGEVELLKITKSRQKSDSTSTIDSTGSSTDWSIPNSSTESMNEQTPVTHRGLVQSVSEYLLSTAKKRKSKRKMQRSKSTDLKGNHKVDPLNPSKLENSHKPKFDQNHNSKTEIDPETVKRLMGAVSFGYGAFQLSISLLPPSMLKLVSFFGFEGDREAGLTCLKYSRTTKDMRSPLATIALLWYLTIGSHIFASDDQDLDAEIQEVEHILKESTEDYEKSALFMFFNGRYSRMKREMENAIEHFKNAYYVSVLPELRLLSLHEIGWCRLIKMDCENAIYEFDALRLNSQYSRSFFVYLTAICHGVAGNGDELSPLKSEIFLNVSQSVQKESQIDKFLMRRYEQMPDNDSQSRRFEPIYWRYFVYEMLFLWNALDICSTEVLDKIVLDCDVPQKDVNEPIPGVSKLVLGACETYRGNFDNAVKAYRDCLKHRESHDLDPDQSFGHISAFACFKLAMLLMKYFNKKDEAKQLLVNAQQKYKNYDFESRLSVRIHGALKQL